ncbi:MAG: branched-chain amino acid ABC transporter permease [Desulfurococcales archaeon]|nr:branched-chain amino acid ABC transporter permease [Desulfurococcales archaeon]
MPVDINTVMNSFIYAGILSLLSLGITLAYMTTGVFNFAHPRLAIIGSYAAATVVAASMAYLGMKPNLETFETAIGVVRQPLPLSVYALGLLASVAAATAAALVEYYAILRPLQRRGADFLKLMIATLAYDFILVAGLFLYSTLPYLDSKASEANIGISSTSMTMTSYDVWIWSGDVVIRGMFIMGVSATIAVSVILFLLLFKTKLGIKMRASVENPDLARVLGINVDRVYAIAWAISGATAGVAGFIILFGTHVLKPISATSPADEIVVSAFAGSIVGGINSVFGSIGGGFLIGLVEKLFTNILVGVTGYGNLLKFGKVFSMAAVVIVLLFMPEGLASVRWKRALGRLLRLRFISRGVRSG